MPKKKPEPTVSTRQIQDGKWENTRDYYHICCDCSLAHLVEFRMKDGQLQARWTRCVLPKS